MRFAARSGDTFESARQARAFVIGGGTANLSTSTTVNECRVTVTGGGFAAMSALARGTITGGGRCDFVPKGLITIGGGGTCNFLTTIAFSNGYTYRRLLGVAARGSTAVTLTGYLLYIKETQTWLKSASHTGGKVQSESGWDIRFETIAATPIKMAHELVSYDPATGTVEAYLLIPSWTINSQFKCYMFYGKAGLSASEANATATYANYVAVWDARTGVDRTGNGRSFTMTNIGAGTLIGDAGSYNGTSSLAVQTLATPTSTFVKVADTIGLGRAEADIIVPTGLDLNAQNNNVTAAANKTIDLRDMEFHSHDIGDPRIECIRAASTMADGVVIVGGKFVGQQPDSLTWAQMKHNTQLNELGQTPYDAGSGNPRVLDDDALLFDQITTSGRTITVENCYFDRMMDGINGAFAGTQVNNVRAGGVKLIVRGCYCRYNRDDFIENDGIQPLEMWDTLVDGTYMGISQRPGNNSTVNDTTNITKIRNCLIRMQRMPYTTDSGRASADASRNGSKYTLPWPNGVVTNTKNVGYTHGAAFKASPSGSRDTFRIDIADSIVVFEAFPEGSGLDPWPTGTYSNVLFIWAGIGTRPPGLVNGAYPSGVTVKDDPDALDFYRERALWLQLQGCTDNTGDDFPWLHA